MLKWRNRASVNWTIDAASAIDQRWSSLRDAATMDDVTAYQRSALNAYIDDVRRTRPASELFHHRSFESQ